MDEQYEYEIHEITEMSFQEVTSLVGLWPQSVAQVCLNVGLHIVLPFLKAGDWRVFLVRWTGDVVPRGAKLAQYTIASTEDGFVAGERGLRIGYYDRLVESGGDSGKEQAILVRVK